jgi:hypothetical protein
VAARLAQSATQLAEAELIFGSAPKAITFFPRPIGPVPAPPVKRTFPLQYINGSRFLKDHPRGRMALQGMTALHSGASKP